MPSPPCANARRRRRQPRGFFFQLQSEPFAQELVNPHPEAVQRGLVVGEEEQVIHVPHVADRTQFGDDEMVERIEVEVRQVLAREVADREPPANGTVRHRMPDDAFDRCEQARVGEALGEAAQVTSWSTLWKNDRTSSFRKYPLRRAKRCARAMARWVPLPRRHA